MACACYASLLTHSRRPLPLTAHTEEDHSCSSAYYPPYVIHCMMSCPITKQFCAPIKSMQNDPNEELNYAKQIILVDHMFLWLLLSK
jgi:hypothetical protein